LIKVLIYCNSRGGIDFFLKYAGPVQINAVPEIENTSVESIVASVSTFDISDNYTKPQEELCQLPEEDTVVEEILTCLPCLHPSTPKKSPRSNTIDFDSPTQPTTPTSSKIPYEDL